MIPLILSETTLFYFTLARSSDGDDDDLLNKIKNWSKKIPYDWDELPGETAGVFDH
ncbi:hypothetical protein SCP_0603900 [Sparassis crispa]|uniref:Uncharacterized protein n=1 Tax=Sparassis crispa TaxID=139825 RepID=A0A401GQA0_9APHY|nr:hypothetical protein SCP_0603900 [Sparassis crispa]GBE84411.1 hypothetical protein SCP_0603900 [Sparassis crispa]